MNPNTYQMADKIFLPASCGGVVPLSTTEVPQPGSGKKRKSQAMAVTCEICGITCNSDIVYQAHINGAKHKKKMVAQLNSSVQSSNNNNESSVDLTDLSSTEEHLRVLAKLNNVNISFTTTSVPSAEGNDGQFEMKLVCGDQVFEGKGASAEEARHIATLLAMEKMDFKVTSPNTSQYKTDISSMESSSRKQSRLSTANSTFGTISGQMFPLPGYPSSTDAEKKLALKRYSPVSEDVNQYIQKNLMAPVNLKMALQTFANDAIKFLGEIAISLANELSSQQQPRIIDPELVETPPAILDAVRLTPLEDNEFAVLLWAIRIGPYTLELLHNESNTAHIVVLCAQQPFNSLENASLDKSNSSNNEQQQSIQHTSGIDLLDDQVSKYSFLEMIQSKLPDPEIRRTSELLDDVLILRRVEKLKGKQVELFIEIDFTPLRSDPPPLFALRRQLWMKQNISRNKNAMKALRIVTELSRRWMPRDSGLALIPGYTWEVLIGLCVDILAPKTCCTNICSQALCKLASGMMLNGGTGLADPCALGPQEWSILNPPVAGCEELDASQRLSITSAAQRLVLEVVCPHIDSRSEFLESLMKCENV